MKTFFKDVVLTQMKIEMNSLLQLAIRRRRIAAVELRKQRWTVFNVRWNWEIKRSWTNQEMSFLDIKRGNVVFLIKIYDQNYVALNFLLSHFVAVF